MGSILLLSITTVLGLTFDLTASKVLNCQSLNSNYQTNDPALQCPNYGSEPQTLKIEKENDLEYLLQETRKININLIERNPFNSIDDYLEFYEDFQESKSDFVGFFKNYKPKFRGRSGFVDFPIELLNEISQKLSKKWENISESLFVAASQYMVPISEKTVAELNASYLKTVMGMKINHMFAAIRFSLDNQVGHILFDPGYGVLDGIVVMRDEGNAFKNKRTRNVDSIHEIVYKTSKSDKNFIIGRSADKEISFLLYVGTAYCSMYDITQKLELLRFDRYVMKRNSLGWPTAGYSYDTLPQSYRKEHNIFSNVVKAFLDDFDSGENITTKHITLYKFQNDTTIFQYVTEDEGSFMHKVAFKLGMRRYDLYEQLIWLQQIARNEKFMSISYRMLMNIYKIDDPDDGRSLIQAISDLTGYNEDTVKENTVKEDTVHIDNTSIESSKNESDQLEEPFLYWVFRKAVETVNSFF